MARNSNFSRRTFLARTAALSAAAVAMPQIIPSGVLAAHGAPGAADRVIVGVIGVGGRANLLIGQLPEAARIVAVADCYLARCDETLKRHNAKWRVYHDYRKLLEDKEIDAVIIGTHDHGRVLPCIHACQAGKDIYAEKPLTLAIGEGKTLVQAVRKYHRVFQVGSQQRSMAMNRIACDFIRNGGLGKLTLIRGVNYTGPGRYEGLPEAPKPAGLDWDMWLGQTEMRPYNPQLQFGWMGWRDYSGGEMTNWGAHGLDQIQWGAGMDGSGPQWIWPLTPGPNGAVAWTYPNGLEVRLDLAGGPAGGGIFIGPKGKIEVNRNKFTSNPKDIAKELLKKVDEANEEKKWSDQTALWQARWHMENWLDCIRTRNKPVADVEIGHRSISLAHLANICRELGRKLHWDPVREQFVDDAEANTYVSRPRRKGYELPELT